jgi:hypothetical protein
LLQHHPPIPSQSHIAAREDGADEVQDDAPDIVHAIRLACVFCPLWFAANYTFNASLSLTSVASNTVLSTTSGLFTFLLGLRYSAFPSVYFCYCCDLELALYSVNRAEN